ncbi:uncharacterized protein LOC143225948 isoform X1 [Tachypleus tridentatus]|uniref:uncharacterized protein LOC143225948 isoform X1 n=2 Tax=Tachypleus tridentatus TaxID=6853 RepID=UPI003FD5F5BB
MSYLCTLFFARSINNWMLVFTISFLWVCGWHIQKGVSNSMPRETMLLRRPYHSTQTTNSVNDRSKIEEDYLRGNFFKDAQPQLSKLTESELLTSYKQFYQHFFDKKKINHLKKNFESSPFRRVTVDDSAQQNVEDIRQANEHFLHIRQKALCQTPRPLVVDTKDYYPDPTKKYLPRCTILHRCTEDSGCCDNDRMKCGPRKVQEVTLYFYTLRVGKQGTYVELDKAVAKLMFINHTECECQFINKQPYLQDDPESDAILNQNFETTTDPQHLVSDNPLRNPANQVDFKCRECPMPFSRREYFDGKCSCDCFDHQKPCIRIKRGRSSLSNTEKRCVRAGQCQVPECEYGHYNFMKGKCPERPWNYRRRNKGRKEKSKKHHPYHRWSFYERD